MERTLGAALELRRRTIRDLAEMICGNGTADAESYFEYRSNMYLSEFFQDLATDYQHDGHIALKRKPQKCTGHLG
ncbi:hypothetical protein OHA74_38185 [Streptomyces phaeochromogenes]|uniref:hypothetical protein n=1 Tax=Streptomyces phaeochromogenes TaxID=1923 RepID=UPI002E2A0D8D|nr:hypothetical protein [Streptomyces phaeochromogenes]